MEERNGKGILRWILIILAVVLVLLICWKAGWILNGNKNQVSEQEKQEAIQEAVEEINSELQEAQSDHLPQNPAILVSSVDMFLLDGIKNNINYNYYEDHSIEQWR